MENSISKVITGWQYLLGLKDAEIADRNFNRQGQIDAQMRLREEALGGLAHAEAAGGSIVDDAGFEITAENYKRQIAEIDARLAALGKEMTEIAGPTPAANSPWIDELVQAAQEQAAKSQSDLGANNVGGLGKLEAALKAAQDNFDLLTAEAKRRREEADAAAAADREALDADLALAPDVQTAKQEVVGSFSAAALAAQGEGLANRAEQIAAEQLQEAREQLKVQRELKKQNDRMLRMLDGAFLIG
jgi:hypothetical protein